MDNRQSGIVKNVKDKFGFIAVTDGEDRFFHWSGMSPNSPKPFHHLHVGDTVTFLPIENEGKAQAVEVIAVIKNSKKEK